MEESRVHMQTERRGPEVRVVIFRPVLCLKLHPAMVVANAHSEWFTIWEAFGIISLMAVRHGRLMVTWYIQDDTIIPNGGLGAGIHTTDGPRVLLVTILGME